MIRELSDTLLAQGELERVRRDWAAAEAAVKEVLRLAAPRKMLLVHADALVLRARIALDRARDEADDLRQAAERAGDDLRDALKLARGCGYAWAERDALAGLAETCAILGQAEAAMHGRDAEALSRRVMDTTRPDADPYAFAYVTKSEPPPLLSPS